jgi:hypothetical protein
MAAAWLRFHATGCLATRQDVQVLQQDLRLMRAEAARDDSLRALQIQRLADSMAQINRHGRVPGRNAGAFPDR